MLNIKLFNFTIIIFAILLSSCSNIRESAGVTRKSIDEFQAIENPPLIIPPDFNLIAPNQLQKRNIDDIEKELAQEILFGLNEEESNTKKELSIMSIILSEADAKNVSNDIREEFDQEFAQEKKINNIFQNDWKNEDEVLDAVGESERLRNKNFEEDEIPESKVPTKTEKVKIKKKKRFFFF